MLLTHDDHAHHDGRGGRSEDTAPVMGERAAWLAERRNGLGGSDIAGILGVSPWTSPWSIYADKVGLISLDRDGDDLTEAMEFGTMAEPMLAAYFARRTGLCVAGEQMVCKHPDFPWMRCTLDGLVFDAPFGDVSIDDAIAAAEWKTTGDSAAEWEADGVPVYYQTQATWTSIVTGLNTVWFGVLHLAFGRPQFRTYEFTPDAEDKGVVIEAATRFWHEHVCAGIPPATDEREATTDALRKAYPGDDDLDAVEATDELVRARDIIVANKQAIKAAESVVAAEENRIRAALGDHSVLTAGADAKGKPIVLATWKRGTRSSIDTAALKAAEPELAAQFAKTTETRTLLVKTPKAA